jgi:hypothetical protein
MHLNSENETKGSEKWGYWAYWESHRNMLMELVHDKAIGIHNNHDKIAIFGAGECDDIDLKFLTSRFNEVYIIDKDIQAMENGRMNQQLTDLENSKIILVGGFDFAGVSKKFYMELEELFRKNKPLITIISYIRNEANKLEMPKDLDSLKNKFLVVLSAAVHSQLCNGIYEIFNRCHERYNKKEIKEIEEALQYLYSKAVIVYNDLLLHVGKADASLLIALDLIEISEAAGTLEYLPAITKGVADTDIAAIADLTAKHGVLGSVEGQDDIISRIDFRNFKEYINEKKIIQNFWLWSFDSETTYMMHVYTMHLSILKQN